MGTVEEFLYRIQPISLTTNNDGIVLEAIDLDDQTLKTFLINRIVDIFDNVDYINNKKVNVSSVDLKFNFENEKVLNSLNHKNINLIDNQATVKFYSEAHALNYAVNHFNEIEILAPQSIVNKISIRKKELIKKLKI